MLILTAPATLADFQKVRWKNAISESGDLLRELLYSRGQRTSTYTSRGIEHEYDLNKTLVDPELTKALEQSARPRTKPHNDGFAGGCDVGDVIPLLIGVGAEADSRRSGCGGGGGVRVAGRRTRR